MQSPPKPPRAEASPAGNVQNMQRLPKVQWHRRELRKYWTWPAPANATAACQYRAALSPVLLLVFRIQRLRPNMHELLDVLGTDSLSRAPRAVGQPRNRAPHGRNPPPACTPPLS